MQTDEKVRLHVLEQFLAILIKYLQHDKEIFERKVSEEVWNSMLSASKPYQQEWGKIWEDRLWEKRKTQPFVYIFPKKISRPNH